MAIGRPLAYDPDTVLDAAMSLFWQRGYEATSLSELTDAMQLSKSSLYQSFGSKKELFLMCLDRFASQTAADLSARLERSSDGKQFVEHVLLWVIDEARSRKEKKGCLLVNTATEFAQSDTRVAKYVARGFEKYRVLFQQAVRRGQSDGTIRSDREAALLADYLVTTMSGLRTMVKAGTPIGELRQMVRMTLETIS